MNGLIFPYSVYKLSGDGEVKVRPTVGIVG